MTSKFVRAAVVASVAFALNAVLGWQLANSEDEEATRKARMAPPADRANLENRWI